MLSSGHYEALLGLVAERPRAFHGRVIWNQLDRAGGGVVEMLPPLLAYCAAPASTRAGW